MSATSWRPNADLETLRERAALSDRTRAFFAQRGVLEVTTPILSRYPIPTPNLQSFATRGAPRFLRTSPELAHKRLLAAGSGDIFELGPVFRQSEQGARHNSEFTLLEWYRVGMDEHELMHEVNAYLRAMMPALHESPCCLSYERAFELAAGLDIWTARHHDLETVLSTVTDLPDVPLERDDVLDLLFGMIVAPTFDTDRVTLIYDYPASQAVLAAIDPANPRVAQRFEAFVGPLELANGFFELRDATEQRRRFDENNAFRRRNDQPLCEVDLQFLAALEHGLPACSGVAVGFDRVVMQACGQADIAGVLSFAFDRA